MSSVRFTTVGVMRPPKPPCWRDFVSSSPKSIHSDGVEVLDASSRALGALSPVADLLETSRVTVSLSGNKPSRLVRRPRARIHRTRSEHIIRAEDLPQNAFTATLADADPKGLRVRIPDGRLYVEENNRRCQNWLAGVEAAEPLDDVDYNDHQRPFSSHVQEILHVGSESSNTQKTENSQKHSSHSSGKDPGSVYELPQNVDVEIPEETFMWETSSKARSTVSDEEMSGTFRDIEMSGTFKDILSQGDCEKISEIPVYPGTCSTHSTQSLAQSPALNSKQETETAKGSEVTKGDNAYESDSGDCTTQEVKCDKRTGDNTFKHCCCGPDNTESSSEADYNCCRCQEASDRFGDSRLNHVNTQDQGVLTADSRVSLPPDSGSLVSRRVIGDSQLWALDLSTCD
ncbi:unnamed protein product [Candidula unifasciata]|uniref:Uncharacterized protein n=1 Tax=Candidula unifasciata TaxID=100452 RepID=A0A8S3ZQS5_9EUPU|nr:unnamed protein product [Candidula unifasciata]